MRPLKYHEQKLLKKVALFDWKKGRNIRETEMMSRYGITKREQYVTYNITAGQISKLARELAKLPTDNKIRMDLTRRMSKQLYDMGVIQNAKSGLDDLVDMPATWFARRRLAVVLVSLKMAQNMHMANRLVEDGHIRIGPKVVTDPAQHVTRGHEDFVTWVDSSAIKRKIQNYTDTRDDFELMN
eukprot:gnl/Dysnectes_brevis/2187_a2548_2553.p1 GENE.gnl/Dysnectes_brevis/2187_a2548_2553~~gnl/Dysnectes_brevis/2187_a2548_2553.p1  ORF type:complete len:184 (-),score=7.65 gnl/Dysnectes_brevis/2187_a2548_2553:53-604(-)